MSKDSRRLVVRNVLQPLMDDVESTLRAIRHVAEWRESHREEIEADLDELRRNGSIAEDAEPTFAITNPDYYDRWLSRISGTVQALERCHEHQLAAQLSTFASQLEGPADVSGESVFDVEGLGRWLTEVLGTKASVEGSSPVEPSVAVESDGKSKQRKERGYGSRDEHAAVQLLSVYTNGLADERLDKAKAVLCDDSLTADKKLWEIDKLMPLPPDTSAANLGKLLGVSKTAVQKTAWYIQNRKGRQDNETGRRRDRLSERGRRHESDRKRDDDG